MKNQSDICREFDIAVHRLNTRGIAVQSDSTFLLSDGESGDIVGTPATVDGLAAFADALDFMAKKANAHDELVEIARLLSLATNEGDDASQGTHYVDKHGRIRCKGSFLELIERARAALAAAGAA